MYCSERVPFLSTILDRKAEKIRRKGKIEKYKKLREELIEK